AFLLDIDFSDRSPSERKGVVKQTEEVLASIVDVSNPPMLRAALCDFGPGQAQELLIVIHHWVNDPVSFQILLEDLETAYQQLARGQDVRLPAKTTSFKSWAEEIVNYGKSDQIEIEADYWRERLNRKAGLLPTKSTLMDYSRAVHQFTEASLTRKE